MEFLKKHYDKVLLAVALVLVIVFGFILILKVSNLSRRLNQPDAISVPPHKAPYEPLDMRKYAEALNAIQHPSVWTPSPVELFYSHMGSSVAAISNKPIAYLRFEQLPFDLLFKAYSWDTAKKAAFNFQISLRDLTRTYFVVAVGDLVKDKFGDTGYSIVKFEQKAESVYNPSLGHNMEADRSEITLERSGEDPIVLELGKVHLRTEPVATIVCREDPQKEIQTRLNQSITCPSNTYIVVDINEKQMVIRDSIAGKQDIIEKYEGIAVSGSAGTAPPPVGAVTPSGTGARTGFRP